jgi:hypothetical protein
MSVVLIDFGLSRRLLSERADKEQQTVAKRYAEVIKQIKTSMQGVVGILEAHPKATVVQDLAGSMVGPAHSPASSPSHLFPVTSLSYPVPQDQSGRRSPRRDRARRPHSSLDSDAFRILRAPKKQYSLPSGYTKQIGTAFYMAVSAFGGFRSRTARAVSRSRIQRGRRCLFIWHRLR